MPNYRSCNLNLSKKKKNRPLTDGLFCQFSQESIGNKTFKPGGLFEGQEKRDLLKNVSVYDHRNGHKERSRFVRLMAFHRISIGIPRYVSSARNQGLTSTMAKEERGDPFFHLFLFRFRCNCSSHADVNAILKPGGCA